MDYLQKSMHYVISKNIVDILLEERYMMSKKESHAQERFTLQLRS